MNPPFRFRRRLVLRLAGLVTTRLEESASGPARKYYALTPEGLRTLETMNVFLETLERSTRQVGGQP